MIEYPLPFLASLLVLAWPDILVILTILGGLAIPFLALNALFRTFRKRGTKDRLTQLESLRAQGLISEEEYQLQRRRILDTL